MVRPGGHGPRQAGGHQPPQGRPQAIAHPAADLGPVEAEGQGLAQLGIIERWPITEQAEVADLQGRPHPLPQFPPQGLLVQGPLLVGVQAGGQQYVYIAATQGAVQPSGGAHAHQGEAVVAGPLPPVALEGFEPLQLRTVEAQPVGPGTHKAASEIAALVVAVGRGRHRREVYRAEQGRQGGVGPAQVQPQPVGTEHPHRLDAIAHHIAEFADGEEAPQAEGHGFGIKAAAVVEAHPLAQGNLRPQAIGTEAGQGCGQPWFDLALGVDPIKGVAQGAQQLQPANSGGLGRISGVDVAGGGHHQRGAGATAVAAAAEAKGDQNAGQQQLFFAPSLVALHPSP